MAKMNDLNEKQTQFPKTGKGQPLEPQIDTPAVSDDDDDLNSDDDIESENI